MRNRHWALAATILGSTMASIDGTVVRVVTLTLVALISCSQRSITFAPFENVTRAEVRTSGSSFAVNDAEQIRTIVDFANDECSGWETPWYGIPVPDTAVDLYSGKKFLGHLGVGPGFLETQRAGTFASKPISRAKESAFRQLVHRRS